MEIFLHRQQRKFTCAVAAIRTVLHRQFGVRVSEAALVALGTDVNDPIVASGSDTGAMRKMVRSADQAFNQKKRWTLYVRRYGTWAQLRAWVEAGRWPIVQVSFGQELLYHAVVVVGIEATRVLVFDPGQERKRSLFWMTRSAFEDWWTCAPGEVRWCAVINGGELVVYD
jgi:hypothetical protein